MTDKGNEVRGTIGMRVRAAITRPDPKNVALLASFGSNLVADGMNRFGVMANYIRPLKSAWKLTGPVVTVRVRPADNLMVMRSIEFAQPGDVLVISTAHHPGNAVWGELMALAAIARGIAGVVTDGGARDLVILQQLDLPVFAAGITPAACDKDGPGEINYPIAVGNVPVLPGDIVVADDDGVVVVPAADVDDVIAGVRVKQQNEVQRRRDIEAGILMPVAVMTAVDAKLKRN